MGFRQPLDLSGILKSYEVFGGSNTAGVEAIGTDWWEQPPESVVRAKEEAQRAQEAWENDPHEIGLHSVFSTCTSLTRSPEWCADVLGYYRTLGVHWRATKKEIREAFLALGPMPTAYQMHVLQQLLNPAIRRAYDLTPLGQLFFQDEYVQRYLKAKAAEEAKQRTMAGVPTTAKDVIREQFNFTEEKPDDTPDQVVDEQPADEQDAELSDPAATFTPWPYGYYVWKSKADDTERLREWQELLVRAFADQEEVINLAVGFVGRMAHRYVVARVGTRHVIFLGDEQTPTEELAGSAATALLRDMHQTR